MGRDTRNNYLYGRLKRQKLGWPPLMRTLLMYANPFSITAPQSAYEPDFDSLPRDRLE